MTVVVDTDVVAYYLLGTPDFAAEVRDFWHGAGELIAPAVLEVELANLLWLAACRGVLAESEALLKLRLAARLGIRTVATRTLWQGGLVRALGSSIAVYDTLFVELAERERSRLVTFDRRLIDAFPDLAGRPRDLPEQRA